MIPPNIQVKGTSLHVFTMQGVLNDHPGSFEELELVVSLDGAAPIRRGEITVAPGQLLDMGLSSPVGRWTGTPVVLLAQLFPIGAPTATIAGFPEIQINPTQEAFDPSYGPVISLYPAVLSQPFGFTLLPPGGINLAFNIPPGITDSAMLQGLATSPMAANGIFAATDGVVLNF